MKKAIYLFSGIAGVLLSACKKDYNCNCTYTYGTNTYTYNPTGMERTVEAKNNNEAEDACDANWISAYASANNETEAYAQQIFSYYNIKCTATKK